MNRYLRLCAFGLILATLLLCGQNHAHASTPDFSIMGRPDVLIDVGHGGIDGGTSQGLLLEKDINLAMAAKLCDKLRKAGLTVAMDRTGDYALSDDNPGRGSRHRRDLSQRTAIANLLQPKVVVSLHVNWSKARSKSGPLVLYQNTSRSIWLAVSLQKSLNRLYQSHAHPEHGKTFFLLNHCKSPTVIVEMGFLSNESDRKRLTSAAGQAKIASAIATGIKDYLLTATEQRSEEGAADPEPPS